jgi:arylsulfatase
VFLRFLPLALIQMAACRHDAAPSPATPLPGPPSIVLVSLDTLRADRLGAYGGPDGLTPNLDHFAGEAVVFAHAYSQANTTAPSHASLFTSRYPSEETATGRRPVLGTDKPTLAEVLRAYAYQTAAFTGGADLDPAMGLTGGFDTWKSPRAFGSLWHTAPLALAWLAAADRSRPFFLFVHGYDAHARYLKPSPYGYAYADASREGPGQQAVRRDPWRVVDGLLFPDLDAFTRLNETTLRPRSAAGRTQMRALGAASSPPAPPLAEADLALLRGSYDGAVAWADTWFGLLMAGLAQAGILDSAVVVVLSDHGEQLGEEGLFQHCCGLSDEETHVPLMVRLPGGAGGGRTLTAQVGLLDVAPTLVELAGGQPPAGVHGVSFAPALRGEPFAGRNVVFTQGDDHLRSVSARSPAGRLTYTGPPYTSPLLGELIAAARVDGPGFTASDGLDTGAREQLRSAMVTWLASLAPAPRAAAADLSPALKAELRAHGYWDVR